MDTVIDAGNEAGSEIEAREPTRQERKSRKPGHFRDFILE